MIERIWIDERTGRLVVVEDDGDDDWEEPVGTVLHPCCRADELAWWLRLPGKLIARQQGKRYEHK